MFYLSFLWLFFVFKLNIGDQKRMSLLGQFINKLFVRAQILGDAHLRITNDVIYVLETSRSEHIELLNYSLKEKGAVLSERCLLSADKKFEKALLYRLEALIERLEFDSQSSDIKIVPVSIYHGHFPNRESSWWRVIFSERLGPKGWWSRLVQLIVNGRRTLLQLDKPISLKALMSADAQPSGATAVRIRKELVEHFEQRRTATFGPSLSNRKQLIKSILKEPSIVQSIQKHSIANNQSFEKSERYSRQLLSGVTANLSPSFTRILSGVFNWFFKRVYRQLKVQGIDNVRQIAKDHQVVYLPCHRSHMDYVLLSWSLHNQGLMIPHVVAGDNLNAPLLGLLLKRGGAIFMRRSFRDDVLYSALFNRYIQSVHTSGLPLEYFIEGGRSRTGRLLPGKTGLLRMTIDAAIRADSKPIAIVPVWISYDKLVESRSYSKQLSGEQKRDESFTGLLQSLALFKGKFGDAVISFASPIKLSDRLSKFDDKKVQSSVLARQVMERINSACYVNETALIATVLLSQRRLRMTKDQLVERVNQLSSVLLEMPNLPRGGVAKGNVNQWIEDAQSRNQLSISGADVFLDSSQACEMTFYRNQIHHLTLLVGLYLLVAKRYPKPLLQTVPKLIKGVYPYLAKELYWPWQGGEINDALKGIRKLLVQQQLVLEEDKSLIVRNTALSVALMQTVEPYLLRYFIVFRLLLEYPDLTEDNLVEESARLATLLHLEFGFHSPEYTDVKSIANFIKAMQQQGVLVLEGRFIRSVIDAEALMVRSKQILLPHYMNLIESNLSFK